jgi:hypothetical protein
VEQLKSFFADQGLPLTKAQEQKVDAVIEAQQKGMRELAKRVADENVSADEARRLNQEYFKQVNAALTPEQQSAWRHYRIEQIRLRGGFPALKTVLEEAGAPLDSAQQKSIAKVFDNFAARRTRLSEGNAAPSITDIDRLVVAEFDRVVALLSPEQRRALLSSRRNGSVAISRR